MKIVIKIMADTFIMFRITPASMLYIHVYSRFTIRHKEACITYTMHEVFYMIIMNRWPVFCGLVSDLIRIYVVLLHYVMS